MKNSETWPFPALGFLLFLAFSAMPGLPGAPKIRADVSKPIYEFEVGNSWLTMKDGVRLSVTFFRPVPHSPGEKFPVLLDYYPYRKDEDPGSTSYYTYFARRGYVMASVDIRGTGSSEGAVPDREYSEPELEDALEIIGQLSGLPESNGRVGMWGKSWGGFNSIQVAMRRPPALKAILAVEATDDLFLDDIHHLDGAFHGDEFMPYMDNENILPQTPGYRLDEAYFENRFNHYPWFLTYARNQLDGDFWRRNSLRWQYDKINVPCYLIGGLLDGYRDSIPRMLENMKTPVRAVLGPYKHDWPDDGVPGPNYEWRHEAVRWWDYWLKNRDTGIMDEARFVFFLRDGHGPDMSLQTTPGRWAADDWPVKDTTWKKLYPSADRQLWSRAEGPAVESLKYIPSCGVATGLWWGEPTGDLRPDDAGSLVFDSPVLDKRIEIVGFPKIFLRVSADAPLAHWVARLEDVQPDGAVSLVTGRLLNGSQRRSRLRPEPLVPGDVYDLEFEMHFTTWTFKPGHRIRLSVSNSLWPMIWPTPYPMTTKLFLGEETTRLELPMIPPAERKAPAFLPPEKQQERQDAKDLGGASWPQGFYEWEKDLWSSRTSVEWKGWSDFEIQGRLYHTSERNYYETFDNNPSSSRFSGEAGWSMVHENRRLELRSAIDVISDQGNFYVTVTRHAYENGRLLRRREWKETIPRMFN